MRTTKNLRCIAEAYKIVEWILPTTRYIVELQL